LRLATLDIAKFHSRSLRFNSLRGEPTNYWSSVLSSFQKYYAVCTVGTKKSLRTVLKVYTFAVQNKYL